MPCRTIPCRTEPNPAVPRLAPPCQAPPNRATRQLAGRKRTIRDRLAGAGKLRLVAPVTQNRTTHHLRPANHCGSELPLGERKVFIWKTLEGMFEFAGLS